MRRGEKNLTYFSACVIINNNTSLYMEEGSEYDTF